MSERNRVQTEGGPNHSTLGTCSYSSLMLCIYRVLTSTLYGQALEMVEETGQGSSSILPKHPIFKIYDTAVSLCTASEKVLETLGGGPNERELLANANGLLSRLKSDVLTPLKQLKRIRTNNIPTVAQLGEIVGQIAEQSESGHKRSEELFRSALTTVDEQSFQGTVVSIDMVGYSGVAEQFDKYANAKAVFEINESLLQQFTHALHEAGGSPIETPIIGTGDGALVFTRNPLIAVTFAIKVQSSGTSPAKDRPKRPHRFRVGVATGEYFFQREIGVLGDVQRLKVGGLPIITAVRIQEICRENCVSICNDTYSKLPDREKSRWTKNSRKVKNNTYSKGPGTVVVWTRRLQEVR